MDTNFKSYYGFKDNLDFWSKVYSEEDIKKALLVLRSGAWWAKDPTPTLLFIRKSPKGEPVDYIGELLNLKGGENTLVGKQQKKSLVILNFLKKNSTKQLQSMRSRNIQTT